MRQQPNQALHPTVNPLRGLPAAERHRCAAILSMVYIIDGKNNETE